MTKTPSGVQPLGNSPTSEAARLNKILKSLNGPLFFSRAEYDDLEITLCGRDGDAADWKLVIAGKLAGPIILPGDRYAVTGITYSRSMLVYAVTLKPCIWGKVLQAGFKRFIIIKPTLLHSEV